jgi:hypothetical protein
MRVFPNNLVRKKSIGWFSAFLLTATIINGQVGVVISDTSALSNPNAAMDRYHQLLRHSDPMMYLAFPVIKPILDRAVPLKDGEGKDGYWAEGHFGHRFVIYQGKYYSPALAQRMRLTFDVSLLTRLTQDYSNPLLPTSNKFGFGLDYLFSSLEKLNESKGGLIWTTIQLHHYSNGQADSFFLNTPTRRNNYKSGDFSTNHWRVMLNISSNSMNKNLVIAGLGYQNEVDLDGPFSKSEELTHYYGERRILFHLHWLKKPIIEILTTVNRNKPGASMVKREVQRQFGIRTEFEFITGDLSAFAHDNKYRVGWHTYFNYMPSVTNEIGFIVHSFLGRDYLNIRFDDVVFVGELGLYFKFNR